MAILRAYICIANPTTHLVLGNEHLHFILLAMFGAYMLRCYLHVIMSYSCIASHESASPCLDHVMDDHDRQMNQCLQNYIAS